MHGANRSGRPFTGDHAGILLYESLHRLGLASRPASVSRMTGSSSSAAGSPTP
jgi:uracil-DNA glycosylase